MGSAVQNFLDSDGLQTSSSGMGGGLTSQSIASFGVQEDLEN